MLMYIAMQAEAGSIRGQYCISVGRNIIHASDSFESATHEIGMWFKENELSEYKTANFDWVFSNVREILIFLLFHKSNHLNKLLSLGRFPELGATFTFRAIHL